MYEKREILWAEYAKTKTLKHSQKADVLEYQLEEAEKTIELTDNNLYNEIKNYMEQFNTNFHNWMQKF